MNESDGHDREVREYVRSRMAADMPPEFSRDVMNDVHRTTQRRRGFAWPILAGLATVAAAVALVVIGLGILNQPNDRVGSEPTASPSASAAASTSPTPEASVPDPSASTEATPPASAEPTSPDGEFGPIHSMAPDDAFANAQTCENPDAITTVGEPSGLSYTISFPEDWSTNEGSESRSGCTLFAREPFNAPDDQSVPPEVAIYANLPPSGDFGGVGASTTSQEFTIDGVAAIRYDIPAEEGGFTTEHTIVWVIAIAGNLPSEGNDQPYLTFSTSSSDPEELAAWADVLDGMVSTLDIRE